MQINISEIENKQNLKKRLIQSDRKANSLQKYGMYKYAESPDFEILLFGYQDMQEWLNNLYDCIN